MKKWTKVLSAFVVATVMSASVATSIGCGGDDDNKHEHNYSTSWSSGADGHWHECQNDGCDAKQKDFSAHVDVKNNATQADGEDGLCDVCGYKIKDVTPGPGGDEEEDATIVDGKITNKAQLLAFRQLGEITEGTYKLEADIDLEGVELPDPTTVLKGTASFDGQGHMIMNAAYTTGTDNTGLLVAKMEGTSVTNVKFLNCSIKSENQWVGMISGHVESADGKNTESTKATFSKIEFNSCAINSTSTYGGLLYGGNKNPGYVEISEITVKNGTSVVCSQYGGLLVGDTAKTTVLKFKDLHLDGKFVSSSNGSFISGRNRGDNDITVENAVISAQAEPTNGEGQNGLFAGNTAVSKLTIKNVLIVKTDNYYITKSGVIPKATDYQKIYIVSEEPVDLLHTKLTATAPAVVGYTAEVGTNSVAFLKDTLGLDFDNVWMEEDGGYRLKASSTNIKSPDATLNSIKVSTANAQLRYKLGATEISKDGLVVMGVYSDGVQLVLSEGEGADNYSVDASGVDWSKAGKNTITVKGAGTVSATYEIEIVEQTGFKVYQDRMAHVYLEGAKDLDMSNLSVKSVWSDGLEETLKIKDDYTIDGYDLNVVGNYTAKVHNGEFPAQDIEINVVKYIPVPVEDATLGKVVYVNVDKEYKGVNGATDKGIVNFNEIGDAIKYLEACKLGDEVTKVVYIGEGKFEEHIATNLNNLTLIGKGADKTTITCDNVQSTINPLTDKSFGLNDNATLIVNGSKFKMFNMAVRNDFDYPANLVSKKQSSPQGTALLIGGGSAKDSGDKSVIANCLLYGNQDTLYLKNGRTYFKDTEIQGNIDFIFGEATGLAYFDTCTIKAVNKAGAGKQEKNNGYVTAMRAAADAKPDYGYIFNGCTFTDDGTLMDGSMSLGRPWGAAATVAMINCSFTKAYSTSAYGLKNDKNEEIKPRWYDMSGNSPLNADFKEYGSTGEGAITEAVAGGKIMSADDAALHTKANIFAATNGKCSWEAAWNCDDDLNALKVFGKWEFVAPDAFAYDVDGFEYGDDSEFIIEEGAEAKFGAAAGPWNSNDKTVTVEVGDNTIISYENGIVTALKVGNTTITVSKAGMDSVVFNVVVKAAEKVETEAKTYTYSYDNLIAAYTPALGDKAGIEAGTMKGEGNDFITVASGVTNRTNGFIENKGDGLSVTFVGTGTLTVTFASTGDANKSRLGIKNASGEYIEASTVGEGATLVTDSTKGENGTYSVGNGLAKPDGTGTVKVTMVFTINEAGTYIISCPSGDLGRGGRIHEIVMVDNVPKSGGSEETKVTKTLAIPATGSWSAETALDDFFSIVAGVKASDGTTPTVKVENSKITNAGYAADGLTFAQQISLTSGKVSTSDNGIKFSVDKEATVVIYAAQKSDKTTKLVVLGSDGSNATVSGLKIDGSNAEAFTQLPIDKVSKYEFTVAAGTYYIGGAGGGAFIYGLTVSF